MQRFSYTERQNGEFCHPGKYSQIMDFKYCSLYIAFGSVWTVEHVMFVSPQNWLFTYNDSNFLQPNYIGKICQ